jgi:hypothetical protein
VKIYVSGPMSGLLNNNVPAFNKAAKALRKKGYRVVNPAELDRGEPCRTWGDCLRRDIRHLTTCTDIATLRGYKKSRGATLEIYIGKALSFEVRPLAHYLKRRRK